MLRVIFKPQNFRCSCMGRYYGEPRESVATGQARPVKYASGVPPSARATDGSWQSSATAKEPHYLVLASQRLVVHDQTCQFSERATFGQMRQPDLAWRPGNSRGMQKPEALASGLILAGANY